MLANWDYPFFISKRTVKLYTFLKNIAHSPNVEQMKISN